MMALMKAWVSESILDVLLPSTPDEAQADYVRLEAARQEDRRRGKEAAENAAADADAAPASPAGRHVARVPSDDGVVQLRVQSDLLQ